MPDIKRDNLVITHGGVVMLSLVKLLMRILVANLVLISRSLSIDILRVNENYTPP